MGVLLDAIKEEQANRTNFVQLASAKTILPTPAKWSSKPRTLKEYIRQMEGLKEDQAQFAFDELTNGTHLPTPDLEQKLKKLGLWPADATPSPVNMLLILARLPQDQRYAVYGRLYGLKATAIALNLGVKPTQVHQWLNLAKKRLVRLADALGLIPAIYDRHGREYGLINDYPLQTALNLAERWPFVYRLQRQNPAPGVGGYRISDVPLILAYVVKTNALQSRMVVAPHTRSVWEDKVSAGR